MGYETRYNLEDTDANNLRKAVQDCLEYFDARAISLFPSWAKSIPAEEADGANGEDLNTTAMMVMMFRGVGGYYPGAAVKKILHDCSQGRTTPEDWLANCDEYVAWCGEYLGVQGGE